ncbi:MAG: HD domain-containing protein [Patescibacteria group bacterium]|jgi:hypothetical protein
MKFKKFKNKLIPKDIELVTSENSTSNTLVYIPWRDSYLDYVQEEFKDFFLQALPHLHVRTTDVHTAISLSYLDMLIALYNGKINRRVVALGLILHDIGWASLTEKDIIGSLSDYKGLELSSASLGPKERHVIEGVKVSRRILDNYRFDPPLNVMEKQEILDSVLYHDTMEKLSENGKLVADLDRLWSFTHENFWQDTIRKNVEPDLYLKNLAVDSEKYFCTTAGLTLAKRLLRDREKEIEQSKK